MKFSKLVMGLLSLFIFSALAADPQKANQSNNSQVNVTVNPAPRTQTTVTMTKTSQPIVNANGARLWNLQDADILSVINEVSQETGKNFVVDSRVNGKITLISSKPVKQHELYQVFLSVLGLLGYSAIPSGNVIKIVPNMESGELATRVATKKMPGKGDEVVIRVVPLENVSASQLIPVLRPMLPQWSNISSYTPGNVIILLGRADNLDRINKVIQDVDRATNNGIEMIPLHLASAGQVANVLNNLQNAARNSGETPSVSVAVDERSNSILLSGPKVMRLRMRVLISQLDAPAAAPSGNTEVIYLRYLEAKTLAPLLSKISQNILGKDNSNHYEVSTSSQVGTTNTTSTAKESNTTLTNIQAETNTNAIIITAPPALMQALKSVIAKLDIRPAQVLVQAIIAEIDESSISNLGIQWGSITPDGSLQNSANGSSITAFPNFGAGVFGIMPSVQIQAVLSMLQNQNGVNILSTPSVVVLDNQKAAIEVGQDVPVQTGTYATTQGAGVVAPFNTFDRKAVTLKLEVTPQINLGSSVRLKLNLKNDTLQNPQNPGLQPLINTSKISNSVIINSEDVLVLGGLITNANNENTNRVPIVSHIPVVGKLFDQKIKNEQKKNLMVFIKPIIMQTNDDALLITHMKYNAVRNVQANFRDELEEIGDHPVSTRLPPWKNTQDLPKPFDAGR